MALRPNDRRNACIRIAWELLKNKDKAYYSEYDNRWNWHNSKTPTFPFTSDCSGTVTAINYWAGGNDPNGLDFRAGYTGTILAHARENKLIIPRNAVLHGDLILFGSGDVPVHVVMSMQNTFFHKNPLCFSMGKQGDPSLVLLSVLEGLGEPTFVRNVTRK